MSTPTSTRSVENFREWLKHEIAKSADVGYTRLDLSRPLEDMGISSLHVVRIASEIEKLLGIELEASALWEFASIDEMIETLLRMHHNRKERAAETEAAKVPVLVSATFTAEPIEESIRHLLARLGFDPKVSFARYNQVFQELLSPAGMLATNQAGVNVLLVRIEDWFRYGEAPLEKVTRTVEDFLAGLRELTGRTRAPVILGLCPHSPPTVRKLGLAEHLDALDRRLVGGAAALGGVHVVDLRHIEANYRLARVWDEARDKLGHIPFTQACFTAMGAEIARRAAALLIGPAKVIVLDADNTLWGGVAGEDGPRGVRVDGPFAAIQRFMVDQADAGKLLCIASKNNEADLWRVFDAHPEMPLQKRHLVAWRVNWKRKSENIRELAAELGLGLDTFVFVDDNAMEVAEVGEALPEVLCVQVPEPPRIQSWLAHHWAFDHAKVTEEDRKRTRMYQENRERAEMRGATATFTDFLARLELKVDVSALGDAEVERAAQLTHRTNQFNAVKQVRTEGDIEALRNDPARFLCRVRVSDRFGDYGFVGLVGAVAQGDALVCDLFMMSCRVLGRRVEHTMVRALAEEAARRGLSRVVLQFVKADRNQPCREFYDSLGLLPTAEDRGEVRLRVSEVEGALERAVEVAVAPSSEGTIASSHRALAADGFEEIARAGADLDALQAAIDATTRIHRPALTTEYVTPRSGWEKKIAAIWRDVLRIDRVGIYDNFFELGGDSLRAAEAFARMWDLGVPESISLQTVPDPTVAGLAQAIEDVKAGRAPTLLADRFSLEREGQLADDIRHDGYDVSTYDAPMRVVLLTGGTGYIGAFVIHELFQQTDARVLALVRAATPEDGCQRIVANLRRYDLWRPEYADRLEIVLGDLLEPRFGLSEADFRALAERIDTIFHSAAWVNFVYPYQHLKPTNVDSTETVLRLAIAAKPKPIQVQFVSTLGVVMSTGYGREKPVYERNPLLFADDLLNGYEQTKYASDKMVWTAMTERGIPGAIYRPGMVSGLSDGTYHKLDEFLPQFLKGCIQLGSWPALDTTWEIAPIDFVSKAIVHVAKRPKNLNKAYFVLHPDSRRVSDWIQWHRDAGYEVRGLPWDVWKRELLNLGTERLRKNALFPFVDFVRALSEEQVFFPKCDTSQFMAAIADMDFRPPSQHELFERYTRHFCDCLYYDNLPSGPRSKRVNEQAPVRDRPKDRGDGVDEHVRYVGNVVNYGEAYYVLWNDPERKLQMVVRYVLHDGPIEEAKVAEVWCWFRDRDNPRNDLAVRQRYPLGRAEVLNTPEALLRIGPSGYSETRAWGEVRSPEGTVKWDFALDKSDAFGVERITGMDAYDMFPHFQSNGVKHRLSGTVEINGDRYTVTNQLASDGHYWNTKNLKSWSWAHCARFDNDPADETGLVFEGIGPRFADWAQPCLWLTFRYKGETIRSNLVDAFYYNRELDATLTSWKFSAERGDLRFVGTLTAKPEDQILIIHALPDDEYLYTHISYNADIVIDVERKEGGRWWRTETRTGTQTASFEVTRKVRNPDVKREFRIVRAR